MIHSFRVFLIRIAKILPFIICFMIAISYFESAFSILCDRYSIYGNFAIPQKLISWFIASYFEYEWTTLILLFVLSIAIETCIYNKMACGYLGINLAEKSYFDFELEPTIIYIICIINIALCSFFCYKGISILLSSRKQ